MVIEAARKRIEAALGKRNAKNVRRARSRIAAMIQLDKDGKNVFVLAAGRITKVSVADGKAEPAKFNALKELDGAAERAYLFEHIWRQVREKFYLKDMNGVDWDYYKSVYQKFLPYISDDRDFSEMASEMLGELNASHTGLQAFAGIAKCGCHRCSGRILRQQLQRDRTENSGGHRERTVGHRLSLNPGRE